MPFSSRTVGCISVGALATGILNCLACVTEAQAGTITVDTTADSGAGSLREALVLANDNDTIDFSITGTILLSTGELVIEDNVSITGPGAANLTVSGGDDARVFRILPGKTVSISGLKITNGRVSGMKIPDNAGGGIFNDHSNLTLSQCVFFDNEATHGGGVFTYSASSAAGASLVIDECEFTENIAVGDPGEGEGGGVFSRAINEGTSSVQISNSTFAGHFAELRGGGLAANSAGILLQMPGGHVETTITDTMFVKNSAGFGGGGVSTLGVLGGSASTDILRGTFTDNDATNSGGGLLAGAAFSSTFVMNLAESVFEGNSAATGGGAFHGASFAAQADSNVVNCTFSGNIAGNGGGLANQAERDGTSFVFTVGCIFSANSAIANGGAILAHAETSGTAVVFLNTARITGNSAERGGAVANEQTFNEGTSGVALIQSTVSNNQATADGGAIFNTATDPMGAQVAVFFSTVNGNSAFQGGAVANVAEADGDAEIRMQNSTISGNSAPFGGAALNFGKADGDALLDIAHCTFSGNSGSIGGGIFNSQEIGGDAEVRLHHTILNAGATGANIHNVDGEIDSAGFNMCSDAAGGDATTGPGGLLIVAGDVRNTNPLLGPLADNGGLTLSHALTNSSPAINAGDPAILDPPDFDQRGPGFPRVVAARIDIGAIESALAVPQNRCPHGKGFWKSNPAAWPVTSLVLGGKTYTKAQLLNILGRSVGSGNNVDASIILAHQLIAAKLNIENGSNAGPVSATIDHADALLAPFNGLLPYRVRPNTATGQAMVQDAGVLDSYNSGAMTPNCTP